MSSLINIKNRLLAVKNIKQITKSMEMIASVRFRKLHQQAKVADFYRECVEELVSNVHNAFKESGNPLFLPREVKKTAVVIVSSDRGLCGGYNAVLFSKVDRFLETQSIDSLKLHLIGKKAVHYYGKKKWQTGILQQSRSTISYLANLCDQLINDFLSKEVDKVLLIYTRVLSLMQRDVVIVPFLPIAAKESTSKKRENILYEPSVGSFIEELARRYCRAELEAMHYSAQGSELAARIFAMKAASENAEEMSEHLTLELNKLRQSVITREILETTQA